MNMQKIYYDMAEKLQPYAEPYMDKLCKEAASNATCAGEPYEALADYLSFAWNTKILLENLLLKHTILLTMTILIYITKW